MQSGDATNRGVGTPSDARSAAGPGAEGPVATYIGTAAVGVPLLVAPCVASPSGWSSWFGRGGLGCRGLAAEASSSAWPGAASGAPAAAATASAGADEAGCSYRTTVTTQCFMEPNADGDLVRRCETVRRKFRQCHGRGEELLEAAVEESTEDKFTAGPSADLSPGWPFSLPQPRRPNEDPHDVPYTETGPVPDEIPVVRFFEEFFELAQQLQQGMEREGASSAGQQTQPQPHLPGLGVLPPLHSPTGQAPQPPPGLFGWLFGGSGPGGSHQSRAAQRSQKNYEDYQRDFQEV